MGSPLFFKESKLYWQMGALVYPVGPKLSSQSHFLRKTVSDCETSLQPHLPQGPQGDAPRESSSSVHDRRDSRVNAPVTAGNALGHPYSLEPFSGCGLHCRVFYA